MQIGLVFTFFAFMLVLLYGSQRFARKQKALHEPRLATVLEILKVNQREGGLQQFEVQVEVAGRKPLRIPLKAAVIKTVSE